MALKTRRWDAADTLKTKEDIAAYLDAVLEDGDPDLLKAALGDIARAKGMTELARAAGLGRANLYNAPSPASCRSTARVSCCCAGRPRWPISTTTTRSSGSTTRNASD